MRNDESEGCISLESMTPAKQALSAVVKVISGSKLTDDAFCPSNSSPAFLRNESTSHLYRENYTFSSYYQHSSPVAAMFIIAYLFIFFMCMIGNMLVCFIVLKNRQMRTVTNIFILNLAISDVLVGIFCMPTTLVDNLITGE
ncbi:hypothetical protein lerEdw1_001975 [Lerista edwardsae]|nr:hypothetical protein lerEdw1_001975 [Lerista edwardsae]